MNISNKVIRKFKWLILYLPSTFYCLFIVAIFYIPILVFFGKYSKQMIRLFEISFFLVDILETFDEDFDHLR